MKDYRRGSHCIHKLVYHMVFVTKFRKPLITEDMGQYLIKRTEELFAMKDGGLISGETDKDHMHLLVWLPPNCCISDVIRSVKTQLSKDVRVLFKEDVKKYLYGDVPFWSPSYFIATAGSVSMDVVKQYIESQRTEEHQQKRGRKRKAT